MREGPGVARCDRGVKKEELASPSAVAKAKLGTTSDSDLRWRLTVVSDGCDDSTR